VEKGEENNAEHQEEKLQANFTGYSIRTKMTKKKHGTAYERHNWESEIANHAIASNERDRIQYRL